MNFEDLKGGSGLFQKKRSQVIHLCSEERVDWFVTIVEQLVVLITELSEDWFLDF